MHAGFFALIFLHFPEFYFFIGAKKGAQARLGWLFVLEGVRKEFGLTRL